MKPDPIAWFNELSTLKKTFVGFFFLLTWASLGVLLGLLGALFVIVRELSYEKND